MTIDIPALLEKLRRMEQIASQVETGSGRLFQLDHAATLREAIAALERPLPGVVEGASLNVPVREVAARKLCDQNTSDDDLEHAGTRKPYAPMPRCLYIEKNWRDWLDDADAILAAIDLAPRVSDAYARGVEDAAKAGAAIIRTMLSDLEALSHFVSTDELHVCETCDCVLTADEKAPVEDVTLCPKMAFESGRFAKEPCYSDRVWRKVLLYDFGKKFDLDATAREVMAPIRSLLPNAPATEDAREKEATERDDDMEAAHCVKYYQQRELD